MKLSRGQPDEREEEGPVVMKGLTSIRKEEYEIAADPVGLCRKSETLN